MGHSQFWAAVASARRGGTTASLDVLNKYFANDLMVIPGTTYWNMVHGMTPDEVREDKEGMQTMRNLGRNMAWIMKCIKAGAETGHRLVVGYVTYPVDQEEALERFWNSI